MEHAKNNNNNKPPLYTRSKIIISVLIGFMREITLSIYINDGVVMAKRRKKKYHVKYYIFIRINKCIRTISSVILY